MTSTRRRMTRAVLLSGLVASIAGWSSAALAVDTGTIQRFVQLSDAFHARLPNSNTAGLSGAQKRKRADCILSGFESFYGDDGVRQLMDLMGVLSRGTEFDDPTVIAFNDRYGAGYDRLVSQCTRSATSS